MRNEQSVTAMAEDRGRSRYRLNRVVAWCGFFLGAATGMVMGLWAFDGPMPPPPEMADYADTSRRLLRLGHIAYFGIGFLNLLLIAELPGMPLGWSLKRTAAQAMNVANIFLPVTLMAAAALSPVKYLLPIPAMAAAVALGIAAWGAVGRAYAVRRHPRNPSHRDHRKEVKMDTHSHETELRKFLTEKFERDLSNLPLDASLSDELGLDSLDGLEMMAEIEDHFDAFFTSEHLNHPRTLRNILEALDEARWRKAS